MQRPVFHIAAGLAAIILSVVTIVPVVTAPPETAFASVAKPENRA